MKLRLSSHLGTSLLLIFSTVAPAQKLAPPTRLWSVGPLTKSEPVMGISFGSAGPTVTSPHVDSQTHSIFSATRSVVFVGDRLVLASMIGMRRVEGAQAPASIYQLLSLDVQTGAIRNTKELVAFGSLPLFATNDGHVIMAGRSLLKLSTDLNETGEFDYHATGHKFGNVEDVSPDGSVVGNATSPGFELIDTQTLQATEITSSPSVATSVSTKGFVTDNIHWVRDYPKDLSFVTYRDKAGEHLLYHGKCGGRPQFLTDDLILEPGCKSPLIIDIDGNVVRTLSLTGAFSYAGVSQNGKRFALQVGGTSPKKERFIIYSAATGEAISEVSPDEPGEEQSWTAFSPDGSLFVVGSPLKLTLYRLP